VRKDLFGFIFLGMLMVASFLGSVRAAHSDTAPAAGPTVQVNIFNYKFDPETVTIKAGTTVTWTNKDEIPHTVASTDKTFKDSAGLDTGDSYSYTFTKPGTYSYYCTLHPFMKGTIVVTAAGG
jgi:amicyanin